MPRFDFRSDNQAPVPPEIMAALMSHNHDSAAAYGSDDTTMRAISALSERFETPLQAYLLTSGTAANSLALAQGCPPYGAVLCHEHAHIHCDECGAPEFYGQGLKLMPMPGHYGLLAASSIDQVMKGFGFKGAHEPLPSAVSISQATEWGAVYTTEQIAAISERARAHDLWLHMDGARLANAIAGSDSTPAEMTWRAGVDVLSLGLTKNGALAAEVLVVFREALAEGLERRIMKGGHLLSKQRYLAAQVLASLEQDRWLDWAGNANRCARTLADWFESQPDCQVIAPVQANEVFVRLNESRADQLRQHGFAFHPWPLMQGCYRFVAAWDGEADILQHALSELDG